MRKGATLAGVPLEGVTKQVRVMAEPVIGELPCDEKAQTGQQMDISSSSDYAQSNADFGAVFEP